MRKILVAIIAFCLLCPNLLSAQQRYKFGPEEKDYKGYLFTFFKGNNDESVYYAISTDGYNYRILNDGKPVISKEVSSAGGLRDPHILRAKDGKIFIWCVPT